MSAIAVDVQWQLPYEVAAQKARETRKPMLVFVGNLEDCIDCKQFIPTVCSRPEFIAFARENLVCTQILEKRGDSQDERWKKSRIIEAFNIPNAHAVIIANRDGKRIGELSTAPQSIHAFIQDIKTIVAKAPTNGDGRLKYSEVGMFDTTFVPEKTYTSPLPKFSKEPLKGRYINFMTGVRVQPWENTRARSHGRWREERARHTPEIALKMRKTLAEAFPGARMTWGWSYHALVDQAPNYVELRKLMAQFHAQYGDEITFWPGVYFEDKFNTVEQSKKDLHDGLELVSKMVGDGYRPQSVLAGIMSVEVMKFLVKNEGIHVVQGQIWSQFNVDGQGGDGGIIYPYYPSRGHYLKPAQGSRRDDDFLDVVNIDGWSVDFFAARNNGGGSRDGIGPLETNGGYGLGADYGTKEMLHVTDVHFNEQAVARNGYGYLPDIWELCIFAWLNPNYLSNWLKAIRAKYPDTQMLTLGEFGELWRAHNPDNSRINLTFVERGNGLMPSPEEGKKMNPNYHYRADLFRPEMEIRWYFNKDSRFATMRNWKENGPLRVMDYTRYNQPYLEPAGNVVDAHWDLMDLINQKETRAQDRNRTFSSLPLEEQQKILTWYPKVGQAESLPKQFFVFDNGLRHERLATIDQKLDFVKSVGFDGLSWRTDSAENIRTLLAGAKKRDLKVFAYYANIEIKQDKAVYSSQLKQLIELCKGTDTCIWPNITSKVFKNSDPAADDLVVPVVRELAGLCESNGVRLVLYPHVNIWLYRIEDAVRIAKKVNHPNCGVAFNLCHALSDGKEANVPDLIREAAPYLRLVSINGANVGKKGPILPLGKGSYDVAIVLRTLDEVGYKGPVGLQCFAIPGDPALLLPASMHAWKRINGLGE